MPTISIYLCMYVWADSLTLRCNCHESWILALDAPSLTLITHTL